VVHGTSAHFCAAPLSFNLDVSGIAEGGRP
jgi:hypothetical protein